jgi:uncharacterized protein YecT (DUF1311 family)
MRMTGRAAARVVAFGLTLFSVAALAAAPTAGVGDGACAGKNLGPREFGDCMRKAQEESDRSLVERIQAIHRLIDSRTDATPPQKQRWKRALDESQAMWTRFRNNECQELVPFEAVNKNRLAEEQRACILGHNASRADELLRRYPSVGGTATLR